jgi:hypothetical protein
MAASGHGHSARRYQHNEAVFVSGRYLDHLSAALAGKLNLISRSAARSQLIQ